MSEQYVDIIIIHIIIMHIIIMHIIIYNLIIPQRGPHSPPRTVLCVWGVCVAYVFHVVQNENDSQNKKAITHRFFSRANFILYSLEENPRGIFRFVLFFGVGVGLLRYKNLTKSTCH